MAVLLSLSLWWAALCGIVTLGDVSQLAVKAGQTSEPLDPEFRCWAVYIELRAMCSMLGKQWDFLALPENNVSIVRL